MINPQWLELPMSRTIFYSPKDVRAIEVRLYKDPDTRAGLIFCFFAYLLFTSRPHPRTLA